MATGALDANGIWQYGEDDSNTTFSSLLNRLGTSIGSNMKGRIAQVATKSTTTAVSNSTTTAVSYGLNITFTPKFSTSKIICLYSLNGIVKSTGADINTTSGHLFFKDSSSMNWINQYAGYQMLLSSNVSLSGQYVETAGSTTARTYDIKFLRTNASGTIIVNVDSAISSLTIIEVTQ